MTDNARCGELDRWMVGELDDSSWRVHCEQCAGCREQAAFDAELCLAFEDVPRPELSAFFRPRLMAEIASAPTVSTQRRELGNRLLLGYWVATALTGGLVLHQIEGSAVLAGVTLLVSLWAGSRLSRLFGCGLSELVWVSCGRPAGSGGSTS